LADITLYYKIDTV